MIPIGTIAKSLGRGLVHHAPTILTGLGGVGLVTTAVASAKGAVEAHVILQEYDSQWANDDSIPDRDAKMTVKLTWRSFLPAIIWGGVSLACIIGAHSVSAARSAAIMSLYGLSQEALKEFKEKAVEKFGERKVSEVQDAIAEKRLSAVPSTQDVIFTGLGDVLCYDCFSGRKFRASMESLKRIENDLNFRLLKDDVITLNDMYYEMRLGPIKPGDLVGWDVQDGKVEFDFRAILYDEEPCLVLDYDAKPLVR